MKLNPGHDLVIIIIIWIFGLAHGQLSPALDLKKYPGEACNRDCNDGQTRICYFHWTLEFYHTLGPACRNCGNGTNEDCYRDQCVDGDGAARSIMTINRKSPGPALHVCQNDLVVVDVMNAMGGTAATIHWHGFHQRQTPFMDGVPFVTQCPIEFANSFRYSFFASESGTQWYHSHTGHHKTNGHYGGFVVRRPKSKDPNGDTYDFDLPEHLMVVSDMIDHNADMYNPGLRQIGIQPTNFLINGRGFKRNPTSLNGLPVVQTPIEVFRVKSGKRYRFRVVNAFSHVCPSSIEIEGHSLQILASDSFDLEPVTVEKLITNAGERYDFVIDTNQCTGCGRNFWIRLQGIGVCGGANLIEQFALLTYDEETPDTTLAFDLTNIPRPNAILNIQQRTLNHPDTICGPDDVVNLCVTDLSSYDLGKGIVDVPYNVQFFLGFEQNEMNHERFFSPNNFKHFQSLNNDVVNVASVNRISFEFPPISLSTQLDEVKNVPFCDSANVPERCSFAFWSGGRGEPCNCIHKIQVKLGDIVELVILDASSSRGPVSHPFHLHGYQLFVIDIEQNPQHQQMSVDTARQIVARRPVQRASTRRYPIKDTISIPPQGYTRFRFRADNPGFWLLHCHYEWHMANGMGLIFQVGDTSQMVTPPTNFPKCGNYNPDVSNFFEPRWIPMDGNSQLPLNCHIGGYEDSSVKTVVYIGRKRYPDNEVIIGKYMLPWKTMKAPREGREQDNKEFEIFCGGRMEWVQKTSSDMGVYFSGGQNQNGIPYFICQADFEVNGKIQRLPGQFYEPLNCCNIAYGGIRCISQFKLLKRI